MSGEKYSEAYDKGSFSKRKRNELDIFQQLEGALNKVEFHNLIGDEESLKKHAGRIINQTGKNSTPAKIIREIEAIAQGNVNAYRYLLRTINTRRIILGLGPITADEE